MLILFLLLLPLLIYATPAPADPGFDEKYERDYNIFNPASQYAPDNPLNPAQALAPDNPFNPANRFDPGDPVNPTNRYSPNKPFNPANRYNPDNPLTHANRYNPNTPFARSTARGDTLALNTWKRYRESDALPRGR